MLALAAPAHFPSHPALMVLAYEDERTDVHGVACRSMRTGISYACACGFETEQHATDLDASADLISHALTTCADCGNAKPSDAFPRCSACAF